MKTKKAFTLIELLVVIAIIALLLAILMPSLKKAKLIAKTVVCVANCKTLNTAWSTYAADNHDKMVSAWTGFAGYFNPLKDTPIVCPNPWVDWAGPVDLDDPANVKDQIRAVERGVLFPYLKTIKIYRCPSSKKDQARCYTISDSMGNEGSVGASFMGGEKPVMKTSQIRTASDRLVFIDEDDITFGGYTIWFQYSRWWDQPPERHNDGVTIGYADGHAEYYKYRDKRTVEISKLTEQEYESAGKTQDGNQDIEFLVRGVYGTKGF